MARTINVILVDDLDGETIEGVSTVKFGLDDTNYEIDLGEANATELREALARYIGAARKVGASRGKKGSAVRDRAQSKAIRDWAVKNGQMKENARGRIPAAVATAYEAAH